MGRSQPRTEGDIVFEFLWAWVRQRGSSRTIPLPSEAPSPSSPPLRPWGSLHSAEPCLTETQPPYKSHPPIYLMCSSTRKPSIRPRGARISKHSNSLGVQISSGPELYSQIHKSSQSFFSLPVLNYIYKEICIIWTNYSTRKCFDTLTGQSIHLCN